MHTIGSMIEDGAYGSAMARREVLRLVAVGLFASPFAVLAANLPTLMEAGEFETKDGKRGYSLVTKTKHGSTVHATATPNRLVFDVRGIKLERRTRLVPFLGHPEELTAPQTPTKEAVAKLLEASGSFVMPFRVQVTKGNMKCKIHQGFIFLGEEDPDRRILQSAYRKIADHESDLSVRNGPGIRKAHARRTAKVTAPQAKPLLPSISAALYMTMIADAIVNWSSMGIPCP